MVKYSLEIQLKIACEEGNVNEIESLLNKGANSNFIDADGKKAADYFQGSAEDKHKIFGIFLENNRDSKNNFSKILVNEKLYEQEEQNVDSDENSSLTNSPKLGGSPKMRFVRIIKRATSLKSLPL